MVDSNRIGKDFESKVFGVLLTLSGKHPEHVVVKEQPRFLLHDGQEVFPDFEICFQLSYETGKYLIECQSRKTSSPQIAQKIRYMKSLSARNRFIFIHEQDISNSTKSALRSDGVMVLRFEEFVAYIAKLDRHLTVQREAQEKKPKYDPELTDKFGVDPDDVIPPSA